MTAPARRPRPDTTPTLRIGELARLSGRSVHTIRWYEAQRLMPGAARDVLLQGTRDRGLLGAFTAEVERALEEVRVQVEVRRHVQQATHLFTHRVDEAMVCPLHRSMSQSPACL